MKQPLLVALLCAALAGAACTGSSAEQLFETAQLEERQNNPAHARQLYEQIIRDFPDSPFAKQAAERLTALSENR